MLYPLKRLLDGRDEPLCAGANQTIREALALMVEHDYSQLPVVNEQGELLGLISDGVIAHRYYHLSGAGSLLDLTVDHCLSPAVTLPIDRDIFEALDRLKDVYAIVITVDDRPKGILTEYDMAHFFRDLTEDLLIVENIEVSLRQIVQSVFDEEQGLNGALIAAFGEKAQSPGEPNKGFDQLTFGQLMQMVECKPNWAHLEKILGPQEIFHAFMDQVRNHRNQLAHFRGQLDSVQHNALKSAEHWLEARPRRPTPKHAALSQQELRKAAETRTRAGHGKYEALQSFLEDEKTDGKTRVNLEFREIEKLLGEELPESARKHRAWWSNHYRDPQAEAWMRPGWLVDSVDLRVEEVTFRQSRIALYPFFFEDLLNRLKSLRPGITQTSKASTDNWLSLSAGTPGFSFAWVLPKEPILRVELYIDDSDPRKNRQAFNALKERRQAIEQEIGEPLEWDEMAGARACRIYAAHPFHLEQDPDAYEKVKDWGAETMLKMFDAFQPRLRGL